MKSYKHLFFDLDGTLWDLHTNTRIAIEQLFLKYQDRIGHVKSADFIPVYTRHNDAVWALYRQNKIEKSVLRTVRFERAFADCGVDTDPEFIEDFATDFIETCPNGPHTIAGTHELLEYCKDKYRLHIITNGFPEVQGNKMSAGKLDGYFREIVNSESVGARKPDPSIFEFALNRASANKSESLMIGDDWDADILGARDFGIDQVFLTTTEDILNRGAAVRGQEPARHNYKPTYVVRDMFELKQILESMN